MDTSAKALMVRRKVCKASAIILLAAWVATVPASFGQPDEPDDRWLLYWAPARPSLAGRFETAWQAQIGDVTEPLLTFRTEASAYAFMTPLRAGEGREASYRLGPPAPTPPVETALTAGTTGAHSWVLQTVSGSPLSATESDQSVHIGLWLIEPTATPQAALRMDAWSRQLHDAQPTATRWILHAVEGSDLPLWVTIVAGPQAHESASQLAFTLAPTLRAALPSSATLRAALSSHGSASDAPMASLAEPIEPLPLRAAPPAGDATATRASSAGSSQSPRLGKQQSFGLRMADGARESVRRAPRYDTSYAVIPYPNGDPGWESGSGADVLVRSLRSVGIDLQRLIHQDLLRAPEAYGAVGHNLDTNIDHRRLRNLITFLKRHCERLSTALESEWRAGDIVIWDVHGHQRGEHIGVVTERGSDNPWVVHHFPPEPPFTGRPAEEQVLDFWPRLGHFRVDPERLRQGPAGE